jgi:hypothetical protein
MSKQVLRIELHTLLQLSKPKISLEAFETILQSIPTSFDWTYFLDRAIASKLAGSLLPYTEIAQQYYPAYVLEKIKAYQQRILLHSSLLRSEILDLAPKLEAQELDYALLKGWDLHFRYGVSLKQRQISDIDVLIRAKDLDHLEALLQQNGYQTTRHNYKSSFHQKWLPTHAPLIARKAGLLLDVHTNAFAKEHGIELPLHLDKKVKIELQEGGHIWVLNENEAQLFLAFHAIKHLEALHDFKGAQIVELTILGIEASELREKEKILLDKLAAFLNRFEKQEFNSNEIYDVFFVQQLEGGKAPLSIKYLSIRKRLKLKTSLFKSLILALFDLFPSKAYLESRFGKGNYLVLNLKRLQ